MAKSTRTNRSGKSSTVKPPKPYPDFPLGPHPSGTWQKKIAGKLYYFGRWGKVVNGKMERLPGDGWQEALALYQAQRDDLYAGRKPRVKLVKGKLTQEADGLTIKALCNQFLTSMLRRLEAGRKMSPRMFDEYRATTDRLVAKFGSNRLVSDLRPSDFEALGTELGKQYGPVRLGNEIQKVRTVFKYGFDNELVDKPVRYGTEFKKPDKSEVRKNRAANGKRMFEAVPLRTLISAADGQLKAMILLGINCGFGQTDCASLPIDAIDLEKGWITFPRPKTGVARRCPLWPETIEALKTAIAERPKPKGDNDANLVFITKYGKRWVRTIVREQTEQGPKHTPVDAVGLEFRKLLKARELNRVGLGFYAIRHTFRTIADATQDFPAARLIMGHADGSIDDVYREHIDDCRLRTVVDYVHTWLFPPAKGEVAHVAE